VGPQATGLNLPRDGEGVRAMKSLFVGYCITTSMFAHLLFLWAIITMFRLSGP
jgi:hypothetical protein